MALRILWGSPLPPVRSGVSDYAVELLPELSARAAVRVLSPPDLELVVDKGEIGEAELVPAESETLADEIQLIHVGNNPYHLWLLDRIAGGRTVVVLHDLVLHHLLVESTVARGDQQAFEELLAESHGRTCAAALADARRQGISGRLDPFFFPATQSLIRDVLAVVVHSSWAESHINQLLPGVPVLRLAMPAADPGQLDRGAVRSQLGLDEHELVLMHLGFLTAEKGLTEIIGAVAAALSMDVPVHLVLVGEGSGREQVMEAAAALGIADHVSTTGWLAKSQLLTAPAAADLGVALRTPSAGETSAATLRFLACGTPVAVNGQHQFLEWPLAVAPRITPGPSAMAELSRLLCAVAQDRRGEEWLSRRRQARQVYQADHRPETAAEALVHFLAEL